MRESAQIIKIGAILVSGCMTAWAGDAQRGALVVGRTGCLECHAVGGQGAGHEPPLVPGATDLAGPFLTPRESSFLIQGVTFGIVISY